MKLLFLYLSLVASVTKATPIDAAKYNHLLDDDGNSGPCRGSTASDKVDSKAKAGVSQEQCETECDGLSNCVAYSYTTNEGGYCIIYGPGQDGTCESGAEIRDYCGMCSVEDKQMKSTCGSCNIPDGTPVYEGASSYAANEGRCTLQQGKWTEGTWTAGTWNGPADGWIGDSHLTTHVNYVTSVDNYDCYDKDQSDHLAECVGTTDTNTSCQVRFAQEIEGKNLEDLTEADCTAGGSGCTFVAAPVPPVSISFVHPPITTTPGWNEPNVPIGDSLNPAVPIALGACRSEGTMIAPPTQKDCLNDECRGSNGQAVGTQEGCAQACLDDPSGTCVAYSHAANSWCVLHGPHAHVHDTLTNTHRGEIWTDSWNVRDRPLKFCLENVANNPPGCSNCDSAKPNPKYMCQTLKTDSERWEAYAMKDDMDQDVIVTVMISSGTANLNEGALRKRIADLAFWKEGDTSMLIIKETVGATLDFRLTNLLPGSAEPMMRLMNGQFDETNWATLMASVLPNDVEATWVSARTVPSGAVYRDGNLEIPSGAFSLGGNLQMVAIATISTILAVLSL